MNNLAYDQGLGNRGYSPEMFCMPAISLGMYYFFLDNLYCMNIMTCDALK